MRTHYYVILASAALIATPVLAQPQDGNGPAEKTDTTTSAKPTTKPSNLPPITIQRIRANDQRGVNVFEAPKDDATPFTGFRLGFGAAFTQQFQGLGHSNTAAPKVTNGVNANQLITMGHGFNNAIANAYVNVQLAKGVRVALTSYLSTRHHNETWVKDGYALIDDSPIDFAPLNRIMQFVTLKAGHFEINYGDAHFRRTDGGQAMFNPLVGNYIMDAFTTEVGGEAYLRGRGPLQGAFLMGAVTNGEVRGTILNPAKRSPAFFGKVGVDRQVNNDLRVRLTGTLFSQSKSNAQTLYTGDRSGSRYYDVLENTASTEAAQAWSGAVQPFSGASTGQHSAVINPFLKVRNVEYFGSFERAKGRNATETDYRTVKQIVNEVTVRGLKDNVYLTGRYNTVTGPLAGITNDIKVRRTQLGGGWFVTPTLLTKLEWVNQKYLDFPTTDIRNGGQFKGFMVEGTIAF
jgi:hypothetical protein